VVTVTVPADTRLASFFNVWVYLALMVLACVILGSRAALVPKDRAAWLVFTAATAAWTFGELWSAFARPESFPSLADVGFLAFYPLAYVGLVLLLRGMATSFGGMLWLDGLAAALTAGALASAALVDAVLETTEGSVATVATNLAYPLGDVLLLSAIFGAFSLMRWRVDRRLLLVGLGVLSTALADSVYLFQSAAGTYVEGTWVDVLWPAALLLIAFAALVPEDRGVEIDVQGRPLLAVPATSAVLAIAILVYDHFRPVNALALALATATMLVVVARLIVTFRENGRLIAQTRTEAVTDALTGLGNRRKLLADLSRRLEHATPEPALLMIFDLDGFKSYNDTFGHPAGDALLARLGGKLAAALGPGGAAYRLGGDEFCIVSPLADEEIEHLVHRTSEALSEQGEGFHVGSSFGAVVLPDEAADPSQALRAADERLYSQKRSRRTDDDRSVQALLDTLAVLDPQLQEHLQGVSSLALEAARSLGLRGGALDDLARAARLHDIGKIAVPDEILRKPGPLDAGEWAFVRQHTLVGERILRASPALHDVASIVRATHERWDGTGYPDGLAADDIPLASRIICVCDAYDAMTSSRAYREARTPDEALAELERCAGTQFDPTVVRVVVALIRDAVESERAA
jgi:diguanylate cyclase (GGDEF)-like protein